MDNLVIVVAAACALVAAFLVLYGALWLACRLSWRFARWVDMQERPWDKGF